jgi:hypothetical protein
MANLSITASSVGVNSQAVPTEVVQYGATVTQGQPLYPQSGKYYPTDANDTALKAKATRIALTPGSTDEYGVVATPGADVDLGATLVVGETYVVSRTAGSICPIADLTTGDYVTHLGVASAANNLKFYPRAYGVQKP